MARWSREERPRGSHPPAVDLRPGAHRERALRRPPRSLLDRLLGDLQSHLDAMELADAYPLLLAGREGCRRRAQGPPRAPDEAERGGSDEGGSYRFSLDVAGFVPEELSVKLEGRRLTVRARRDQKAETAEGCVSHEFREVSRAVLLPDDADLDAVACTLDGPRLCVDAPRRALAPAEARTLPITVCRAPGSPVAERKAALPASPDAAGGAAAP